MDTMTEEKKEEMMSKKRDKIIERAITTYGWGLFFIWVGIAVLADVGWGAGLLGVGLITLGGQGARKYFALKLEGFWIAVGSLFALGGAWELLNVQVGLMPILCIAAGISLLIPALLRRPENPGLCRDR